MEIIEFGQWQLAINRTATINAYQQIEQQTAVQEERYFVQYCTENSEDLIVMLQDLGVDPAKPYDFQASVVENGQALFCSGKYYVQGEIKEGEIDGWDAQVNEVVLSLTNELQHLNFQDGPQIEISFECVIPYTLI